MKKLLIVGFHLSDDILSSIKDVKPIVIKSIEREIHFNQKKIHPKHQKNNKYRKH